MRKKYYTFNNIFYTKWDKFYKRRNGWYKLIDKPEWYNPDKNARIKIYEDGKDGFLGIVYYKPLLFEAGDVIDISHSNGISKAKAIAIAIRYMNTH